MTFGGSKHETVQSSAGAKYSSEVSQSVHEGERLEDETANEINNSKKQK